jgi:hypothetical protein
MTEDQINAHLKAMDDLDFEGWSSHLKQQRSPVMSDRPPRKGLAAARPRMEADAPKKLLLGPLVCEG